MITEIPLNEQQRARLSERPTVCVFCNQPVSADDRKKNDVMLHSGGDDRARLCHITCANQNRRPKISLTALEDDDLPF